MARLRREPRLRMAALCIGRLFPLGSAIRGTTMLDLILLAAGLGIFALLAAYAAACERV